MRGDLNDRFQRTQSALDDDNTSEKIIIGVGIVLALVFIATIIGGLVFFVRTVDKFIDAEPATSINPESASQINEYSSRIWSGDYSGSSSSTTTAEVTAAADGFTFGTINGTTYNSTYSGISFAAPSDWILTSHATSIVSKAPRDMSASGDYGILSVVLAYDSTVDADESMDATLSAVNARGYDIIEKNATAKWGGNKFKGIIYKDTYDNYFEVLHADVNTYSLKITIKATSKDELSVVRGYFS